MKTLQGGKALKSKRRLIDAEVYQKTKHILDQEFKNWALENDFFIVGYGTSPSETTPPTQKGGPHLTIWSNDLVTRKEIWDYLNRAGLSINRAAKILGRGESFRKWASKKGSPLEITRIHRSDLNRLALNL